MFTGILMGIYGIKHYNPSGLMMIIFEILALYFVFFVALTWKDITNAVEMLARDC
jgi:hypothetical protein